MRMNKIILKINEFQRKFRYYFIIIFITYVILDLFEIFPYGIGRIPVRPESTIPGLNYLYAIGFSYLFAIIMSIINPKRTILWLFAIPPVTLIYRILKKITKYYKK